MSVREQLRRKARGFVPCVRFGIFFGAAAGALFGASVMSLQTLVDGGGLVSVMQALGIGGLAGGAVGLGAGLLSGTVGGFIGGRVGWGIAGAAGGALASLPFYAAARALGPITSSWMLYPITWNAICLLPMLIGVVLGVLVGRGLERRQSRLPRVNDLAQQLEHVGALPPRPGESLLTGRADLVAAAASAARGDEAAPAQDREDA